MKSLKCLMLAVAMLLVCGPSQADPVIHKFELWGQRTESAKLDLYVGWSNGFLLSRGPRGVELLNCLDGMTYQQAVAMIDKHYKDHPELWSNGLGEEILEALTIKGGPCEGKNPLASTP